MELKEFVSQALVQICQGIKEAQEMTSDLGAIVSPPVLDAKDGIANIHYDHKDNLTAFLIDFDVAVTTAECASSEKGGLLKASLEVVAAKLGGELGKSVSSEVQNSTVSHIRFSIPVRFPEQRIGQNPKPVAKARSFVA